MRFPVFLIAGVALAAPAIALAQTDYQYGYEQHQTTTTAPDGTTRQTTVEKSWVSQPDSDPAPADTAADRAANARLGVTEEESATSDNGVYSQHSKEWYATHLQQDGRYVLDPATTRLEPVADNPEIHQMNRKARAKGN